MKIRTYILFKILAVLFVLHSTYLNAQEWKQHYEQMWTDFQSGKNKSAIENGEKAYEILSKFDTISGDYGALMNNLSYVYLIEKEYKKAINGYHKVLRIVEPVLGKEHAIYLKSYCFLGEAYMNNGQFDKAEQIFSEALNTRKKVLDKKAPFYVYSYILLKRLYENKKDYEKAVLYQDTVITLTKETDGEYHPNHLIEMNNKANIYEKASEFDKAIEIRQLVVSQQLNQDKLDEESFNYLSQLANLQRKKGDLKAVIKTYEQITTNRKKKDGNGLKYAKSLSSLGVAYFEAGNFRKSHKCYFESLELLKKIGYKNTADYAMILNNLAVLYYQQGDFFAAEQYYLKAKEIWEKTIGEEHPDYVYTLNGLAVLYHESGNYNKAEPLYLQGLELTKNEELDSEIKFTLLTNLAELYELTDKYNEAADTYRYAYQLGRVLYGKNNLDFAKLIKKVAGFYKKHRGFRMADSLYSECLLSIKNAIGENNLDYATTLNNRGELFIQTKEYKKAEKDLLESAALTKKLFGEFHYQYSVLLNNLAALYFEKGQIKKCEKNLIRANEIIINKVNESVNYMTEQESESFLNSTDYLFNTYYSFYFNERQRNPALVGFAYDNVLARKGLMLQAEKNLRKSVLQTNDSLLIKDYLEFVALKEKQGRLFTSNQQISDDSIKLISERAETLEKQVTTHPKIINSRAQINTAGWKDVKKSLQKDEVAIEFISFRFYNLFPTKRILYCALILRPGYKNPKMVFLFEEKKLDKLLKKETYHTEEEFIGHLYHKTIREEEGFKPDDDKISKNLYDLIWEPIENYLDGVKTIYYSPGGLLHNISFAALSINDSTYVADKYKLNTLISTRNRISHKRFVTDTDYKVSLYGGIDYDVQPEQIEKLTRSYKKSDKLNIDKSRVKLLTQTISRGTTWSYLHGTLEETEAIEALFKAQKIEVESYKGENAVEETFKQYTGNKVSPNIIHIATHGFFIEDPETNNNSNTSKEEKQNIKARTLGEILFTITAISKTENVNVYTALADILIDRK